MKAVSASIIVFTGAGLLAVGANVRHGDTATFVMFAGCALGIIGLIGWFKALSENAR